MALDEADREWVKLIAKDLAYQVNKDVLQEHVKNCPFAKKMVVGKAYIVGICIGVGVASSGISVGLLKLIM